MSLDSVSDHHHLRLGPTALSSAATASAPPQLPPPSSPLSHEQAAPPNALPTTAGAAPPPPPPPAPHSAPLSTSCASSPSSSSSSSTSSSSFDRYQCDGDGRAPADGSGGGAPSAGASLTLQPPAPTPSLMLQRSPALERLTPFAVVDIDGPSGSTAGSTSSDAPPRGTTETAADAPGSSEATGGAFAASRAPRRARLHTIPVRYHDRTQPTRLFLDPVFPDDLTGRIPNTEFVGRIAQLNQTLASFRTLRHYGPMILLYATLVSLAIVLLAVLDILSVLHIVSPVGVAVVVAIVAVFVVFYLGGLYDYEPRRAVALLLKRFNTIDRPRGVGWRSVWDDKALTKPMPGPVLVRWRVVIEQLVGPDDVMGPDDGVDDDDGYGFDDGEAGTERRRRRRRRRRQWAWWRGNVPFDDAAAAADGADEVYDDGDDNNNGGQAHGLELRPRNGGPSLPPFVVSGATGAVGAVAGPADDTLPAYRAGAGTSAPPSTSRMARPGGRGDENFSLPHSRTSLPPQYA
ncbi:hypothetical protein DFJ73DRAFT_781766 [Zopfochytrium polystomum]|nr:hypothetical protein DFJ73DRAFT_781766 [Zopfochytrium polystomum]